VALYIFRFIFLKIPLDILGDILYILIQKIV